MISGKVRDNEVVIRLRGFDLCGGAHEFEAVLDTGFSAALSLPPTLIASLNGVWQTRDRVVLGDGRECLFDVYELNLEWDGERRVVSVHEPDSSPLLGMELLQGFEVNFKMKQNGKVTIKRMSSR